jgi:hypothetical protein
MINELASTTGALYLNLRERYPFICPGCFVEHTAAPSLAMGGMQMNLGGGNCPNCKASFLLQINEKNDGMIATQDRDDPKRKSGALPDACYTMRELVGTFRLPGDYCGN